MDGERGEEDDEKKRKVTDVNVRLRVEKGSRSEETSGEKTG